MQIVLKEDQFLVFPAHYSEKFNTTSILQVFIYK